MKERPELFSRSKFDQVPYQIDAHDALHAWKLLTCFSNKWIKQKNFDSRPPKPGPVQVPEVGAVYGVAQVDDSASAPGTNSADTGTATEAALEAQGEMWFGPVFARRNFMAPHNWKDWEARIRKYTSDRFFRNIAVSVGRRQRDQRSHAPPDMTPSDRRMLVHHLLHSTHTSFIRNCVLYEPEDVSTVAKETATAVLGPVLSAADAIQSAQEVDFEHESHRVAEMDEVPGETIQEAQGTDDWVENLQSYDHVSAPAPMFKDACYYAGIPTKIIDRKLQAILNPENSHHIDETTLKPWQVTAVAWMMDQESRGLGGGILGDACGLGKTLTALSLIPFSARKAQVHGDSDIQLRPNLVVTPSGVIDVWVQ